MGRLHFYALGLLVVFWAWGCFVGVVYDLVCAFSANCLLHVCERLTTNIYQLTYGTLNLTLY